MKDFWAARRPFSSVTKTWRALSAADTRSPAKIPVRIAPTTMMDTPRAETNSQNARWRRSSPSTFADSACPALAEAPARILYEQAFVPLHKCGAAEASAITKTGCGGIFDRVNPQEHKRPRRAKEVCEAL